MHLCPTPGSESPTTPVALLAGNRALLTPLPTLLISLKSCTVEPGASRTVHTLNSEPFQPGWQLAGDLSAALSWEESHILRFLLLKHPCRTLLEALVQLETLAGCLLSGPQGQPACSMMDMTQDLHRNKTAPASKQVPLLTLGNSSPLPLRQADSGSEKELIARATRHLFTNAHPGLQGTESKATGAEVACCPLSTRVGPPKL